MILKGYTIRENKWKGNDTATALKPLLHKETESII